MPSYWTVSDTNTKYLYSPVYGQVLNSFFAEQNFLAPSIFSLGYIIFLT